MRERVREGERGRERERERVKERARERVRREGEREREREGERGKERGRVKESQNKYIKDNYFTCCLNLINGFLQFDWINMIMFLYDTLLIINYNYS